MGYEVDNAVDELMDVIPADCFPMVLLQLERSIDMLATVQQLTACLPWVQPTAPVREQIAECVYSTALAAWKDESYVAYGPNIYVQWVEPGSQGMRVGVYLLVN